MFYLDHCDNLSHTILCFSTLSVLPIYRRLESAAKAKNGFDIALILWFTSHKNVVPIVSSGQLPFPSSLSFGNTFHIDASSSITNYFINAVQLNPSAAHYQPPPHSSSALHNSLKIMLLSHISIFFQKIQYQQCLDK